MAKTEARDHVSKALKAEVITALEKERTAWDAFHAASSLEKEDAKLSSYTRMGYTLGMIDAQLIAYDLEAQDFAHRVEETQQRQDRARRAYLRQLRDQVRALTPDERLSVLS